MYSMICRLICLFFLSLFGCNQCGSDDGNPYSFDIGEVSEGGTVTNLPSYVSYDEDSPSVFMRLEINCDEGATTENGYLDVRCLKDGDQISSGRFICEEGIVKFDDGDSYNTTCVLYNCDEDPSIGNCSTFEGGPL